MADFEPGAVVVISPVDPLARVIVKRGWRCQECGGAVYHCALVDSDDHVDLCVSVMKRGRTDADHT